MARPRVYATEEERQAALRASWQKYNAAHRAERAAHNKLYCVREDVKARKKTLATGRAIKSSRGSGHSAGPAAEEGSSGQVSLVESP